MSSRPYQSTLKVAFASNKQAVIVQQCLEGDDELQPLRIDKTFQVENEHLIVYVCFPIISLFLIPSAAVSFCFIATAILAKQCRLRYLKRKILFLVLSCRTIVIIMYRIRMIFRCAAILLIYISFFSLLQCILCR